MSQPRIADGRSWIALIVLALIAACAIHRWHFLAWVIGALALLLVARAVSMVFAARASMHDPEDDLDADSRKA